MCQLKKSKHTCGIKYMINILNCIPYPYLLCCINYATFICGVKGELQLYNI